MRRKKIEKFVAEKAYLHLRIPGLGARQVTVMIGFASCSHNGAARRVYAALRVNTQRQPSHLFSLEGHPLEVEPWRFVILAELRSIPSNRSIAQVSIEQDVVTTVLLFFVLKKTRSRCSEHAVQNAYS